MVKEKPEKQIGRAEFRHWVQNFQNKQQAKGKKPLPQTDYDRTLQKEIDKKKRAKKIRERCSTTWRTSIANSRSTSDSL